MLNSFKPIHWIALLLTLKAIFMGIYVTPIADTPDESGHFAYVQDIAKGKLMPKLGEATIRNDVWREQEQVIDGRENYIAQHPPLYYWVAAIPYKVGLFFTDDRDILNHLPRTISALSLGVLLLSLFATFQALGSGSVKSTLMAASIAFIPQIAYLSTGITNDIFLFSLCSMATLYLVRFLLSGVFAEALWCAFWLTLAGFTKMTAWIMIACFFGIMVFEFRGPFVVWIKRSVAIFFLAFLGPLFWMGRNIFLYADPLKINLDPTARPRLDYSFESFIFEQPVVDWLFNHFYALIGFSGYCQTPELSHLCTTARLTRVGGLPIEIFINVLFFGLLVTLIYLVLTLFLNSNKQNEFEHGSIRTYFSNLLIGSRLFVWSKLGLLVLGAVTFYWVLMRLLEGVDLGLPGPLWLAASLPLVLLLSMPLIFMRDPQARLVAYAWIIMAVTVALVIKQSFLAYVLYGQLKGIQGRYFYPYLPLAMAAFMVAFNRLRLPTFFLAVAVLALAWAELHAYVGQVIPFILKVRI